MTKTIAAGACGLVVCLLVALSSTSPRAEADLSAAWNPKAAAAYLDQR